MINPKMKILIVDDYASMRELMSAALKGAGFENLLEAEDGETAWRALCNIKPGFELVVCDWNMPKLSGLELLKKVRADQRFKELPFILCTTEREKDKVLEAIKFGVNNYVVKPFTNEAIMQKIVQTFEKLAKKAA
ncbi:MAG: response regulator [Bdellovibrionota bacterium]